MQTACVFKQSILLRCLWIKPISLSVIMMNGAVLNVINLNVAAQEMALVSSHLDNN